MTHATGYKLIQIRLVPSETLCEGCTFVSIRDGYDAQSRTVPPQRCDSDSQPCNTFDGLAIMTHDAPDARGHAALTSLTPGLEYVKPEDE
jgi:hypothetical protein